jgi:asparagine synthase (glutamine-hydrolysing)
MCGICGSIGLHQESVHRMNLCLKPRGPDHTGFWQCEDVCLGHTRLSIIDVSDNGHQPMANENETVWLTFNGEIYNFKTIRKDLESKGHRFKSSTDTEVIIHLYEEYGDSCVNFLRGMFAFAIWDKAKKKLFAARDRFGIKPFFYHFKNGTFIFASELKALLATQGINREIDSEALRNYFSFGSVAAPATLIGSIKQLLPGHSLTIERNMLSICQYWQLNPIIEQRASKKTSEYAMEIEAALNEAIALRMVSDVPMGAFLSGGIDSSIIVGFMQKHSARPIKTFSVVFEESAFDERNFSNIVAKKFGTDHAQLLLSQESILKEIPRIFDTMDQPSSDGFNTYILSKAVKESGVTVAVSGLGGDELFAGYPLFRRLRNAFSGIQMVKKIPRKLRSQLLKKLYPYAKTKRELTILFTLLYGNTLFDAYAAQRTVFFPHEIGNILSLDSCKETARHASIDNTDDIINTISFFELTTYLRNTLLQDTDRMSMAHALEVRVPFLDHILVEKVFKIPGNLKINGAYPKKLLVDSVKNILPQECYKRAKMGFVFPFEVWLKGKLRAYCSEQFSPQNLKDIPVLNANAAISIWNDFAHGSRRYNYSSILSLLSFIHWYKKYCA